jgi:hypothetical protein
MSIPKPDFTNIIFDEKFKNFVCKEIVRAQDTNSIFYISQLSSYEIYHEALQKFFAENNYNKKPSQNDNLGLLLLLSYPKEMIIKFNNISELKLSFNNIREESDFQSIGTSKDTTMTSTCICNENIMYIHKFMNIYTGVSFQIGSVCNERYGLISKNDINYKSSCQKIKEYQEIEKEIKEGKPIGYYQAKRKAEKKEKIIQKLEKILTKKMKEQEKIMKKEEKQKKIQQQLEKNLMTIEDSYIKRINNTSHYKNCILCKKEGFYSKYCKIIICYNCAPSNIRIKINQINTEVLKKRREYKKDECLSCEVIFIYRYKGILKYLCCHCEKTYKKLKCKLCPNDFIDVIESLDIFCNICDEKAINCLNCKNKFISENTHLLRCNLCQYRFVNKIKVKNCQECNDEFEIKDNENWKTYCGICFKNNLSSVKCNVCSSSFKKLPSQEWRKTCTDCYYKSKNNYSVA